MGWIPKVEQKRHFCHKCKNELVFEVKLQRADTCPHCGVDMHCCKNCEYWDPSAHNQCKERIAEYIPDREKANFCSFCGNAVAADEFEESGEDVDSTLVRPPSGERSPERASRDAQTIADSGAAIPTQGA